MNSRRWDMLRRPFVNHMALVLRIALAGLFAYASVVKLSDLASFRDDVLNYRIVDGGLSLVAVYWLPTLELCAAAFLLWPRHRMGANAVLFILMTVFTTLLLIRWARGLDIACGCFGDTVDNWFEGYPVLLGRDLLLLAVTGFCLLNSLACQQHDTSSRPCA